ncbi:venom prothrombin activator oscutarin-C non-catalytic subunit, partial [Exaiptasia diaphana]|uniref:F5/8 type C domain-containing protein n=1 Tax=Exaiptasia diaphana TaxID=2652724 RepID=A0A913WST0_EXADI
QKYCNKSLGMEDGRIKDESIKASSHATSGCGSDPCSPYNGRLNGKVNAWVPQKNDLDKWLQVNLLNITEVTSVATQGVKLSSGAVLYVKSYKLKYSDNDDSSFQEHSTTFVGNADASSVVKNAINPPIVARYVRVHSFDYQGAVALRIELYGCVLN